MKALQQLSKHSAPGFRTNSLSPIVSDDSELLILVDGDDNACGHLDKKRCHDGSGVLHRAFSLFIFNDEGDLLVQQRAASKRLWPQFWSNSCCSHPRKGEDMALAIGRRCEQELGFSTELEFVYKFEYQAAYADLGSEHELCSVYIGRHAGPVAVNETEIMAWRWISKTALANELETNPQQYTPWFKLEWQSLISDFADRLA